MSIGTIAIVEQLSTNPTVTPTTQPSQPGLTPGGLSPTDNVPTLGKLQAGSTTYKAVVLIEGVGLVLSDAPQASVQAALRDVSGGDWASATVLPGLFLNLQTEQRITPDKAFATGGSCVIRVIDTDHTDTFGVLVNKRNTGAQTTLTATIDRDDTTLNVKSTTGFASSGTVYIGTEAITYTGKTATSFTGCTRGKYSPFRTASTTTRFANHHRIATDPQHLGTNPMVSEVPRVWIGKRVGVWLHTWNEETQALNTHENAQCVYAGRIVGLSENPNDLTIDLEIEHASAEWTNATIGKDIWSAEVAPGMWIPAGRVFAFNDWKAGSAVKTATSLTVVASGAAGTNQMNEGRYTLPELCEKLNAWLAGEKAAARIYGYYTWASPVTTGVGLRTVLKWRVEDASTISCQFNFDPPGDVAAFLGIGDEDPGATGATAHMFRTDATNASLTAQGSKCPFETLVFKPFGPGRLGQEFATESAVYASQNARGTFYEQRDLLPASIKESCPSGSQWGAFVFDERLTFVANYSSGTLKNCWIAPFQLTSDNSTDALAYAGRRADEPPNVIKLRQVLVFESPLKPMFLRLAYSTGTSAYNHATYDTLGYGLGLGLPGELLQEEFERSVANLPGADAPICVVVEEPTKFSALIESDLLIRRAFVRWRREHFELCQWRTPLVSNAVMTLTESNKAAPAGTEESHRIEAVETDEFQRAVVKIDYGRDFATGKNAQYLKSVQVEDQTGVDDSGAGLPSTTIKLRNVYEQTANAGSAIEALLPGFIATMPMFSTSSRKIVRSIDLRYFEGYSVGDVAIVTDSYARDPITGTRGINGRAGIITRITANFGGATPSGQVRDMTGEVEIMFLDVQRGGTYAPSADCDWEANYAGFSAGYRSSDSTIMCRPHSYSRNAQVSTLFGKVSASEPLDASRFQAGDNVVLVERDPADPAAPTYWARTIASVSGNAITFTASLSAPAWDATKKYRLIPADYTTSTTTQRDYAYQADDADELIQDTEPPYHYSVDTEPYTYSRNNFESAEVLPALAYGDGKPQDVGMDRALAATINGYIDYKSAHQTPFLDAYSQTTGIFSEWRLFYCGPVFFGTEHLSASVTRSVSVAPRFNSSDGSSVSVRVTLSRDLPVSAQSTQSMNSEGARFASEYAQATWTTTSTTQALGSAQTLSLGVKDLFFGIAWISIEVNSDKARCPGIGYCIEGARTVAT